MMRVTEKMVILCAFLLFLMPAIASVQKSVDDSQGDVQGISGTVNMPNIDIKKITYSQMDDGSVTVTLQVYGSIDSNSIYMLILNTTKNGEETIYNIYYTKNKDFVYEWYGSENETELKAVEVIGKSVQDIINGTFDVLQGKILRVQFKLLNSSELPANLMGLTMFIDYEKPSMGTDNATIKFELPSQNNNQQNNQQNQDNNNKNGFPGFEMAFLIAAISIAVLLRRKIL